MDIPETDSEDEIPPGWEERCNADGEVFYANHSQRSTQWTHPRTGKKKKVTGSLPFGWERLVSDDGSVTFVDQRNNKKTFIDPRLAFAVEETKDINDFRQKHDSCSTGFQVIHGKDLSECVAIVTGANSGIGYETARTLCFHGCTVVFACRNLPKAHSCIQKLQKERPYSKGEAIYIDLSSLNSVKTFAKNFIARFNRCDLMILNAGVFGIPYEVTEDGFERTFQVNYLSHFYLALLLQNTMSKGLSPDARIIFVSAEAHRFFQFDEEVKLSSALNPRKEKYHSVTAYNNSKLCAVLGCVEFHRRFADLGVKSYAVHPGNAVCTNISRHWWVYRLLYAILRPWAKSLQQACAPIIYCAVSPDISNCSGIYINNCVPCMPHKKALDASLSNALWNASLEMIDRVMGKNAFSFQ